MAADTIGPADAAPLARRVPRPRPPAERSDAFQHLTMDGLRTYRTELADQEGRISYWRRILQARLDIVRAGVTPGGATAAKLRTVLAAAQGDYRRTALLAVVPADGERVDLPVLPSLLDLWDAEPAPGDTAAREELLAGLIAAEAVLSEYRAVLHTRIGAATTELIARYRQEPASCVRILPVDPRSAPTGAPGAPGARR